MNFQNPPRSYIGRLLPDNTIVNRVYDAATDTISVNLASGSINLFASLGSVKLEDAVNATQRLKINPDGSIDVNVVLSGPTDSICLTDPLGVLITPALDSTLIDIRDTAGIKRIVDPVTIANFPASQSVAFPSVATAIIEHAAVLVTTLSGVVMAANSSRLMATFINDSDAIIYLALGSTATLNTGVRLNPGGGSFEITLLNRYTGVVSAISTGPSQNLCITEA